MNIILQTVYQPHLNKAATGFAPNRSILDNAKIHAVSNYVYNIDLKDFFLSIDQARIWGRLKRHPFNLNEQSNRIGLNNIISSLCCHEIEVERLIETGKWVKFKKNVLPQGAPTSPILSNIICQRLDFYLSAVARRFGLHYSRYADDITFSSNHNVYQTASPFLTELSRIVRAENFFINETKTRLQKRGYRQEVTGLIVNDKVNVRQKYIKDLRKWLYYWEQYGEERTRALYFQDKPKDRFDEKSLQKALRGKLNHLRMVVGPKNTAYLKLGKRLQHLSSKESAIPESAEQSTSQSTVETNSLPELISTLWSMQKASYRDLQDKQLVFPAGPSPKVSVTSPRKLLPHNPYYTSQFLNQFAVADRSGFKELVHDIDLNDQAIEEILEKVKSHANFRSHYGKPKEGRIKFLNVAIQKEVIKVIDLFESNGVPYFRKTGRHPFNNHPIYTEAAKKLKAMYRFGTGTESTNLCSDILHLADRCGIPSGCLTFLPDARAFSIRTGSIYTWEPSIAKGLNYIFQGIADHSNIGGEKSKFNLQTKITISAQRLSEDDKWRRSIELTIMDHDSLPTLNSSDLIKKLRGSDAFNSHFRSLCDWIVECDFYEESSKRLNILLPEKLKSVDIEDLVGNVGGFKHKLIFYRAK